MEAVLRRLTIVFVLFLALAALAACPNPEGKVEDKKAPCHENICNYQLKVNGEWFPVTADMYHACNVGDSYPECNP